MIRKGLICGLAALTGGLASGAALAVPVLALSTSLPSPQPLGTTVTISASATDSDPGTISYRFQVARAGASSLTLIRDFSVNNAFPYAPTLHEGAYQFVVTARNNATGNTATSTIPFYKFTPLAVGGNAAVVPTANALVALFSSPPCASGGQYMRLRVTQKGMTRPTFYTSTLPCAGAHDVNFLVAGMRAATTYNIVAQTWNGTAYVSGPAVPFTTGTPAFTFPALSTPIPLSSQDDQTERYFFMATIAPQMPFAADITLHPVWYYNDPSGTPPLVYRLLKGGDILMGANGANSVGNSVTNLQILREIDLAGNILRETNASRVSEQLSALSGIASDCALGGTDCLGGSFHHDAVLLPNGHTLALMDEEKIFTDGTQGSSPTNPVDIIGDIIVDLDQNWQVTWYWRAFDHLDANRAAILGETCTSGAGGCPPLYLTTGVAQDWLHCNALQYEPGDGSILLSIRHQDWIIKINYANGAGSGDTIWTMGQGGDFTINSTDPYPWFSHQHDPGFLQGSNQVLAMFDNGNTRVSQQGGDSRGYVLQVDETNRTVTPILLADLGFFSQALGSAQQLTNGDWHFGAGFGNTNPPFSQSIEVFPDGTLSFTIQTSGVRTYREFQLPSLYTPPLKD